MRAFAANLKTLVQCPALWFWHLVGLLIGIDVIFGPLSEPVAGEGEFMKYLFLSFWGGMVTASMMRETASKPFAFCLPGHLKTVRAVTFAVGGIQSMVLSLMVLAYPGLNIVATLSAMVSAACLGMVVYLLAVAFTFTVRNTGPFWAAPVVFLSLVQNRFTDVRVLAEDAALFHPLLNAALMLPIALLIWNWLGSRRSARTQCGSSLMLIQYFWNRRVTDRFTRLTKLEKLDRQSRALWRWIEQEVLSRMRRLPDLSGRRHTLGVQYALLGVTVPSSATAFLLASIGAAFLVAILGFVAPPEGRNGLSTANILYFIPCIVGMVQPIPLHSALLLPGGRRERYRSSMWVGVLGAVKVLVVGAALWAVSVAVAALIPEITVSGKTFTYLPMDLKLILLPLYPLPLLYACQIGFPRRTQIPQVVILVVAFIIARESASAFLNVHLAAVAIPAILCWWCFFGPLHYHCYHGDLVLK